MRTRHHPGAKALLHRARLKPYFKDILIGEIDAKAIIDRKSHILESRTRRSWRSVRAGDRSGLTPQKDGSLRIDPKAKSSKKLEVTIKAWRLVLDEVASGEMTEEDYDLWKAKFEI